MGPPQYASAHASGDLNCYPELSGLKSPHMSVKYLRPLADTKFAVCRPSRFEDITGFQSQHYSSWRP